MKPIEFKGQNVIFGANQPEYLPLPAMLLPGIEGEAISCWELTTEEVHQIVSTHKIYISQLCFTHKNDKGEDVINPLQPILPMVDLSDNILLKL